MSGEKKSIFQGVLDAVKGQRVLMDPQVQQPQHSGGAFIPRPANSIEDMQQQYLDWQVMKVSTDIYARTLYFNADRVTSYADFDAMDQSPAISAALDIMRDECLTKDEYGQVLQIHSDNERIKESLEDLFHNRLGINYSLRIIIRDMLKYGDYFLYLITNKDEGILNVQALPAREVHREEGFDERDPTACRFRWDGNNLYFEEWQIAHFRLMENSNKMPYGRSILESARKTWKQLQLAMDAMLTYRITRAPDRRVFYVEVGTLEEADIKTYIQNIQRQVKKQPIVNQQNGQVNYRYDPMNITEDYFIPVKGDHHSKIDTLPGACLALDTKIDLLDGRSLMLSEIIEEFESGKELWSYSINPVTGEIVPGLITWAGVTRKNTDVVRLTLDNGETIVCTPDHKFDVRGKGIIEAQNLTKEDSLWAFYKKSIPLYKGKEYEHVFNHKTNSWIPTHKMVVNFLEGHPSDVIKEFVHDEKYTKSNKQIIHHRNFNRFDNSPVNLVKMNKRDHMILHTSVNQNKNTWENLSVKQIEIRKQKLSKMMTENNLSLWQDKDYCKQMSTIRKGLWANDAYKSKTLNGQKKYVNSFPKLSFSSVTQKMFVDRIKNSSTIAQLMEQLNDKEFIDQYNEDRKNIYTFKSVNKIKRRGLENIFQYFGYSGFKDAKIKSQFFNHKVVSVEFLEEKIDTGTLTIDGNEIYNNFHNFSLSVGIFTRNSNMSDIEDIEFLEKQLFSALKVPKPYLNYSENVPGGTSLSQSDIRFAKTINGFQEAAILELKKIAKVHLFFLGYGGSDVNNFELTLNNPSTQLELMKLEIMKARLEVGKEWHDMNANSFASWTWVMENIHGFSKAQIKMMLRQKKIEKKLFAEIDSAAETYKKTGIFKDLDRRYEIDGGVDQVGGTKTADGEEGGGFSASSALGNMDMGGEQMGGGDNMSMDSGPDMGATPPASGAPEEAPAPAGGDEAAPLSESRKRKDRSKIYDDLVDELMETVDEKSKVLIGDGVLAKGDKLSDKVDAMIKRMSEKMGPISVLTESDMINSDQVEVDVDNPLFETYNQMSRKLLDMMNDADQTLFDGPSDEVIDIDDSGDE